MTHPTAQTAGDIIGEIETLTEQIARETEKFVTSTSKTITELEHEFTSADKEVTRIVEWLEEDAKRDENEA